MENGKSKSLVFITMNYIILAVYLFFTGLRFMHFSGAVGMSSTSLTMILHHVSFWLTIAWLLLFVYIGNNNINHTNKILPTTKYKRMFFVTLLIVVIINSLVGSPFILKID